MYSNLNRIFLHTPFNPTLFCATVTDMIQDIKPHSFQNQFHGSKQLKPDCIALVFDGDDILLQASAVTSNDDAPRKKNKDTKSIELEDLTFPYTLPLASALSVPTDKTTDLPEPIYLFSLDHTDYFLLDRAYAEHLTGSKKSPDVKFSPNSFSDTDGDAPFVMVPATLLRRHRLLPKHMIFAVLTGLHLSRWYAENIYCGSCAAKTKPAVDERAIVCPACGRRIYPKIMPAVIVGITNHDQIVLTKYADRPFSNYALVAGFNEIGETLEETVRREVMEEVGLRVKNIRYYKSQPWAIAGDILAGFYCDVDGDTTIHVDHMELKEGAWFNREDVILHPDDFSLTNEMMMMFKEGLEPKAREEEKR